MRAFNVLIAITILTIITAATPAHAQGQQGSLANILTIEDPQARIAAIQKFLKSNTLVEQTQAAREALTATYAQLGENELNNNNIEQANEDFRLATASLPDKVTDQFFEETVIRLPLALSLRGYRNEAIALARSLEKKFAKDPSRIARLGEFYMTIEAPNDAIRALEAASSATESATLHRALGMAYRMGLRLDDAVSEFQQAIKSDGRDKRAYYEMANLYRAFGANADAIKLYQKQLEIDPKHTASYKGMALALLSMGKEDDAAAALNQARDTRGSAEELSGDLSLQTQLAFQYLALGKLKQARQSADAALYLEPRYAWARIAAAEIDIAEGKYFDAERNLLAAKNYASFPTLFFTLGKVYLAVEDFDGAQEQFALAFTYSQDKQFTARLGGTVEAEANNLKDLLSPEHRASVFLDQSPTTDEQFKIAESLVKFNTRVRLFNAPPPVNRPTRGQGKSGTAAPAKSQDSPMGAEARRKQMEDLDQAAMSFVEAENVRRSFRMLYIAQRLAKAGLALGLAVELSEQALGLAEVAVEHEGSLRDFPNFDRNGRLSIFRGRALDAKGLALFKANKNQEAAAALNESVKAYGSLAEGKTALWHLASVRESSGEIKEALELYIAAYEPAANPNLDVNRAVIESLYRKVNGSLDGLDQRIGTSVIASTASFEKPLSKPFAAKPIRAAAGSPEPARKTTPEPSRKTMLPAPPAETTIEAPEPIRKAEVLPTQLPKPAEDRGVVIAPLKLSSRRSAILKSLPKNAQTSSLPEEQPPAPPKPEPVVLAKNEPAPPTLAEQSIAPGTTNPVEIPKTDPVQATPIEPPAEPPPTNPAPSTPVSKPIVVETPEPAPEPKRPILDMPPVLESPIPVGPVRIPGIIALSLSRRMVVPKNDEDFITPPAPPTAADPTSAPSVHTRKRRVTTPDEQPPLR